MRLCSKTEDSGARVETEPVVEEKYNSALPVATNGADEEKSDFVIVPKQSSTSTPDKPVKPAQTTSKPTTSSSLTTNKVSNMKVKSELNRAFDPSPGQTTATLKHNRSK